MADCFYLGKAQEKNKSHPCLAEGHMDRLHQPARNEILHGNILQLLALGWLADSRSRMFPIQGTKKSFLLCQRASTKPSEAQLVCARVDLDTQVR